jgi:type II secretion system protein D
MSKRLLYYTGLTSLFLFWVVAQTPPVDPATGQPRVLVPPVPGAPVVPTPGGPKTGPPSIPKTADGKLPNIPAGQESKSITAPSSAAICEVALSFPKLSGEDLSFLYRQLTGRRVVIAAEATKLELYFVQPPPITYGEAMDLLKAACLMQGFVFVNGGDGWDKLVSAAQGPKPFTQGGMPLITNAIALPEGDEVVSYVMTLKYMKPDEVARVFQSVVVQLNAFGSIVAVPNASALVITENASLIRSLIELQAKIDVPSSDIQTKFIKVQYGDVEELAATLTEIFTQQASAQSTAGVQRVGNAQPGAPQVPGASQGGASSGAAGEAPPVQIVPDARTNRLFVMARPIDLVFIESLIKEFDSPSDQRNFLRRKLKFLAVGDFLEVAQNALTRAFGGSADGGAGGGAAGGRSQTSTTAGRGGSSTLGGTSSMGGSSSRNSTSGNNSSQFGGGNQFGGGGSSGGGLSGGGGLGDPNVSTAPQSVLVGRTLLVADNITNSIVVQGPPAGVEIINSLLDEIDVKADQVMISTVFGQLTLSDDLKYGIDWLRDLDKTGSGSIAASAGSALPDITGEAGINAIANKGLGVYGTIGEHVSGYLQALQTTGDFNVISRPTIFTANNQKGMISSGQQIAVPSNSFNNGNVGGQSTNIEYRDVMLSLEVIPLVNSENEVTLQISLISQGVGNNRTIGSGVNAYAVPDIISRELLTTVTVPNNQTVVLGGLITEESSDDVTGIPILSSIPGLGKLFSTTSTKKSRNELMIFIQPQIIRDPRSMEAANRDMDTRYKISDDLRRSADGPGVLPYKGDMADPQDPVNLPEPEIDQPVKKSVSVTTPAKVDTTAPKATPVKWYQKIITNKPK